MGKSISNTTINSFYDREIEGNVNSCICHFAVSHKLYCVYYMSAG